jgi:hypothetical protein
MYQCIEVWRRASIHGVLKWWKWLEELTSGCSESSWGSGGSLSLHTTGFSICSVDEQFISRTQRICSFHICSGKLFASL